MQMSGNFDPMQALADTRHEFGEHGGVNMSVETSATFTVMHPETMPEIFRGKLGPDGGCYLYGRHFNPDRLRAGTAACGNRGHGSGVLHLVRAGGDLGHSSAALRRGRPHRGLERHLWRHLRVPARVPARQGGDSHRLRPTSMISKRCGAALRRGAAGALLRDDGESDARGRRHRGAVGAGTRVWREGGRGQHVLSVDRRSGTSWR